MTPSTHPDPATDLANLDFREIEEIEADAFAAYDAAHETLTGLPARPGTIR